MDKFLGGVIVGILGVELYALYKERNTKTGGGGTGRPDTANTTLSDVEYYSGIGKTSKSYSNIF